MAKLMSDTIMEAGVATGSSQTPEKKSGLFDGIRKRREAKRVSELVISAAMFQNGASAAKIKEAVDIFRGLEPDRQEKPLRKIQSMLADAAAYPFENDINPRQIHMIADFLTAITPYLPKDESGDPVTEPYKRLLKSLANVSTNYDPEGNHKNYPHVVQACTRALWELGYPSYEFWENCLRDPVTQDLVVTQLLEMPLKEGQNPDTHGWHLLRQNLSEIGDVIAASSSPKKMDFLNTLMGDIDSKISKQARDLLIPLSMDAMPKEFLDLGNPEIKAFWQKRIRNPKAAVPLTQEAAIGMMLEAKAENGTFPGWSLLRENLRHIVIPMANHPSEKKVAFLAKAATNEAPAIANAAFQITASLKPIPGEIITIAKKRQNDAGAVLGAAKGKDTQGDKVAQSATEMLTITAEFLDMVECRAKIAKGGPEGSAALDQILELYSTDHGVRFGYMAPFIKRRHEKAMKDALEGKSDQQLQAILSLQLFEKHNLIVGGTKAHNQVVVDALLEKGPDGWKGVLKDQFAGLAPLIMASHSPKKAAFLASLIKSGNPAMVSRALDVSLVLPQTPEEIVEATKSVKDDVKVKAMAEDFLDTVQLLEKVDLGNGEQFEAAEALVKKAGPGKPGLMMALHKLGLEMKDVFIEPSGSTPEEKGSQKESALKIIAMLARIGIKVPGFEVKFEKPQ